MIRCALKPTTWVKVFGWIFALLGVILNTGTSLAGFGECIGEEHYSCGFYYNFWWMLVVEGVCLLTLILTGALGGLGRAYVAVTGLFVFSTTQLQATAFVSTDLENPVGVHRTTYLGFYFFFVANLLLVTAMGLEHYVKPKWSDDEACTDMDQEAAASALVPASHPRSESVLEMIWKGVTLAVACVGVASLVAALVANVDVDQLCNFACMRNWWIYCVQLLAFVLFIVTEVVLKATSFRPVLTFALATQIRMLEWIAIGRPGGDSDSIHGVQKAGVVIAIAVSYLLLLSLFGTTTNEPPSGGKTLLWGAVLTAAALVGFILKYQDLSTAFPDFVYSGGWQFAMYLLAFIWIIVSCIDKLPIFLNFRLPLVAFIAITIQWDWVLFYALSDPRDLVSYTDSPWNSLEGYLIDKKSSLCYSPLVLIFAFLMVMIVMGISRKGSIGSKSRQKGNTTSQVTAGSYLRGDEAFP